MFCWLPALDFNNQANQPTFTGALEVSRHVWWYKDFSRFLTRALKIFASPYILKLNNTQFLQGPAVRTGASSLIIRKLLGNHTQHLLQVCFFLLHYLVYLVMRKYLIVLYCRFPFQVPLMGLEICLSLRTRHLDLVHRSGMDSEYDLGRAAWFLWTLILPL